MSKEHILTTMVITTFVMEVEYFAVWIMLTEVIEVGKNQGFIYSFKSIYCELQQILVTLWYWFVVMS